MERVSKLKTCIAKGCNKKAYNDGKEYLCHSCIAKTVTSWLMQSNEKDSQNENTK